MRPGTDLCHVLVILFLLQHSVASRVIQKSMQGDKRIVMYYAVGAETVNKKVQRLLLKSKTNAREIHQLGALPARVRVSEVEDGVGVRAAGMTSQWSLPICFAIVLLRLVEL